MYAIEAAMEPGSAAELVTVAERTESGHLTGWTMRPGDDKPEGTFGVETYMGSGRLAVAFYRLGVPDSPGGLAGPR